MKDNIERISERGDKLDDMSEAAGKQNDRNLIVYSNQLLAQYTQYIYKKKFLLNKLINVHT